jgi:hypothetical protein
MSLWGNSDNVTSRGTVSLDYSTGQVTGNAGGSGTQFGTAGSAQVGNVIRFGLVEGTYFGDAVITGITSERVLTIGSTAGLSGAAIASTDFFVSELPKSSVLDSTYSERSTTADRRVYGISTSMGSGSFTAPGQGWVGVTTYIQNNADGTTTLRVKSEILVAQSGISTGANSILYPTNEG